MIDLSLYLVTDADQCHARGRSVLDTVALAVAGGVTCVQLRAKDADARAFLAEVLDVAHAVGHRVPVIVNDRVDVFLAARAMGAPVAGVHVGQSDLPADLVRRLIGPDATLGLSAASPEEIAAAAADPAAIDYIGIGAVHATATKPDAPPALGVAGTAALARTTTLPAVAIGGITASDLPELAAGGLAGAAVVSAICCADDPRQAAAELAAAWASTSADTPQEQS